MNTNDLLKLNVNDHTEKKGNLTYLSWAWAWAEAIKADPGATFNVVMFGDRCYTDINGTAMVWVTATMFGKPMTCQLPVMDHRNKPITNPDAFAVNTAIMRCMTKALSLHGLGLYIYAGEDLPESDTTLIDKIADSIRELHKADDMAGMYGEWEAITDNEVRLAVWNLLKPDSKVRSAIKAYKDKLNESN
tara:strand:- start:580 stop:1149 length:570 start_codon:yes stop_codon:yes gene_type:complete